MNDSSALSLIEPLLKDAHITEILIDDFERVYVEKEGQLEDVPSPFTSEAQVYALIDALTTPLGRKVDPSNPFIGFGTADGSYVHIVIPPVAMSGPSITIRKQSGPKLTMENLLEYGSLSPAMAEFLKICVLARLNILISGGTASGKVTLIRIIAEMIPQDERVILIQESSEIALPHRRLVNLETRPANREGQGEISLKDLVNNAVHMRPDRIILVEARGGEIFDLATAMATGHDGTLVSLYANNPRDAIERFEGMAATGNPSVPLLVVRERVAEALDLIVHQERFPDGSRKIVAISEVQGMENNIINIPELFQFRRTGFENGKVTGFFTATGVIPLCFSKLQAAGITNLPMELFTPVFKPSTQQRKWSANEAAALDRQLGDTVWMFVTALNSAYGEIEIIKQLASIAPAPGAELWKTLLADMMNGFSYAESLENMQQAVPSASLFEIVATFQRHLQGGGHLASLLEPLIDEIWKKAGTDEAFSEHMRELAKAVDAPLPPRLRGKG